jgi:CheY-like chemotaxis protein
MMPGMNGLQFIEALHERVHHVAIVMLTGQATIETAVQFRLLLRPGRKAKRKEQSAKRKTKQFLVS